MNNNNSFLNQLILCIKERRLLYKLKLLLMHFMPRSNLYLDVSSCNLKCILCPNGGTCGLVNNSKGIMSYDLFKKIIDKCSNEKIIVPSITFGNWGEPLLNPDLPKMIKYAKSYLLKNGVVIVNTNLNFLGDEMELLESGVNCIRVSVSGMTQEVYQRNHKCGNIGVVLNNILRLVSARKKTGISRIIMVFHDFIYNKKDRGLAKTFCLENGVEFYLRRPYIMSVEENILFQKDKEKYSKTYGEFIDLNKEISLMTVESPKRIKDCRLRKDFIVVNFEGRLYRCCATFEEKYFMGTIFDYKIREIPKIESPICIKCVNTPLSWRKESC